MCSKGNKSRTVMDIEIVFSSDKCLIFHCIRQDFWIYFQVLKSSLLLCSCIPTFLIIDRLQIYLVLIWTNFLALFIQLNAHWLMAFLNWNCWVFFFLSIYWLNMKQKINNKTAFVSQIIMQMRTVQAVPVQHSDKERILSLLLCVLFSKLQEVVFYPCRKPKVKTFQT